MKKIFLTGSSSYLGTKFTDLYGGKYNIVGVSRNDTNNPIDLNDFDSARRAFLAAKPDIIVHLAADIGRDSTKSADVIKTNPAIMKNLIDLAKQNNTPFVFTSTEAVYGGKTDGMYPEDEVYKPRSPYGESKVLSEKLLIDSGLPYLITRGHRYVGVSKRCKKSKQFTDALDALSEGRTIHVDSKKRFSPVLIDDICDIIDYYIENDADKQIVINVGIGKGITYYDFLVDVANTIGANNNLIQADGEEVGWHDDNSLSTERLHDLGYPHRSYDEVIKKIAQDIINQ